MRREEHPVLNHFRGDCPVLDQMHCLKKGPFLTEGAKGASTAQGPHAGETAGMTQGVGMEALMSAFICSRSSGLIA